MTGKVWLVGAGPGDAGLITVKGKAVLEAADVVVHDRLVGDGIRAFIPTWARCIDVGKEAGHHPVPQEKIQQLLIQEARRGQRVVRLKGGDPFLFGRGAEELEALKAAGIPCEVVPGVTSAVAAATYAGIPVTHRDYASSVHIITAHAKAGGEININFKALAQLEGTLVFLMGLTALPRLCQGLIAAGMFPDTPAAVIERGTTARQRRVDGTLATLAEKAQKQQVAPPALIVVGQVVQPKQEWNWLEALPLFGQRVLVTRAEDKAEELAAMLRALGAEVLVFPCIATQLLEPVLPPLSCYNWAVFTSPTGVDCFFALLKKQRVDIRTLALAKVAAVGASTGAALERRGLRVDVVPEVYDGVHLAEAMLAQMNQGDSVLIPRAEKGALGLVDRLRAKGMIVDELPVYRTVYTQGNWQPTDIDLALFTSASTVHGFARACLGAKVRAICIGKQTAAAAKSLGWKVKVAQEATLAALVKATEEEANHDN
ncbi:MAG: uroporphyrinogen-III C-methyltransferase [Firmicutes bacterium]|nr:uroporphyrinogen-III C-methyltransferase [Bacillota bacterium]